MSPADNGPGPAWTIIIPVKGGASAKTRLNGLDPVMRESLALAFAEDTVRAAAAAAAVTEVVVVTGDATAALSLTQLGARVVKDEPPEGLNEAIARGAHTVTGAPVAVLLGDLPALRSADIDSAIRLAADLPLWFVPDADGDGTTMLAAREPSRLRPAFGPGSRRAHLDRGAVELTDPGFARLRRDVDTEPDLRAAESLGLGPSTRTVLAAFRSTTRQATVLSFDWQSHAGQAMTDDGQRYVFDRAAFTASGLRGLRGGQRVRLQLSRRGEVTGVTLITMP